MTPATPPRSRSRRVKSSTLEPPKLQLSPTTPHRQGIFAAPVTPGTVTLKQKSNQFNRPSSPLHGSPLKGLKTPEYTPAKLTTKRRLELANEPGNLDSVSRVLFLGNSQELQDAKLSDRKACSDKKSINHNLMATPPQLLPPVPSNDAFSSFLERQVFYEDTQSHSSRKVAKQEPGTPSDKIVTFELAKDWNNNSGQCFSSDDEERGEELIKKATLKNPFASHEVADARTRRLRQKQLVSESPHLRDTVTYLNKSGQVAEERKLSKEDQERFRPKALFTEELERETLPNERKDT
ncbi:LAFE_0B00584g1_1 [Lachancea fermentati]|uniref:LAFE_0B00584g1_1 n=1 Tax=Lachancea fermentati TaxID=4955 RepID=A0A1G4M790_LACFM|nr:LAFE_0B00584g1_1 [Lachancea fermentati]